MGGGGWQPEAATRHAPRPVPAGLYVLDTQIGDERLPTKYMRTSGSCVGPSHAAFVPSYLISSGCAHRRLVTRRDVTHWAPPRELRHAASRVGTLARVHSPAKGLRL